MKLFEFIHKKISGKKHAAAAILIVVVLLLPFAVTQNIPANAATYEENRIVRVGLYTGGDALNTVSIEAYNYTIAADYRNNKFNKTQQVIEVGYSDGTNFTKIGDASGSSVTFGASSVFGATGVSVAAYNNANKSANRTFALRFTDGALRINNSRYYTGYFEIRTTSDNKIEIINVLPMEDYLKGVLPYEMSPSYHTEALKAQAIAGRSWTYRNINKHSKSGFNLCATTCCQAYNGIQGSQQGRTTKTDGAVDSTKGLVMVYNGRIAEGLYFSSSGGSTVSIYSFYKSSSVPYLVAVKVPEETSYMNWSFNITLEQLYPLLKTRSEFASLSGGLRSFEISEVEKGSDHVIGLKATDINGKSVTLNSGSSVYSLIGYLGRQMGKPYTSTNFTFNYTNTNALNIANYGSVPYEGSVAVATANGTATYTGQPSELKVATSSGVESIGVQTNSISVVGKGWGHGVGMSQAGAVALANLGYNYEYILKRFYTGVEIKNLADF